MKITKIFEPELTEFFKTTFKDQLTENEIEELHAALMVAYHNGTAKLFLEYKHPVSDELQVTTGELVSRCLSWKRSFIEGVKVDGIEHVRDEKYTFTFNDENKLINASTKWFCPELFNGMYFVDQSGVITNHDGVIGHVLTHDVEELLKHGQGESLAQAVECLSLIVNEEGNDAVKRKWSSFMIDFKKMFNN